MVLAVAGQGGEARAGVVGHGEPEEVGGEPGLEGGEVGGGERGRGGEEGDGLGDLDEGEGFEDAFGPASLLGVVRRGMRQDAAVIEAGGHGGSGFDEPCAEVENGVGGVAVIVGEEMGGGECWDGEAEGEESVAVGGEGLDGRRRGVCVGIELGEGFGVVVVRGTGRAGAGEGGDGGGDEGEVASGLGEDAVVIDGGDIGVGASEGGGWSGLAEEGAWGEEQGGGGGAEGAAGGGGGRGVWHGRWVRLDLAS